MKPRIIPVLLVDGRRRLVKTRRFADEVYVGDPFNVVRIFNEKEVDEICVLDITATAEGRGPNVDLMRQLASECFMPLSYGGAIQSVRDAAPLFEVGIEKVVLGRAGGEPDVVEALSEKFGSQAVTVCIDCRQVQGSWRISTNRGNVVTDIDPVTRAKSAVAAGAGEILLQNVDRDGERAGYDLPLIAAVSSQVNVPLVALGGAGELKHLAEGLAAGASAVASGSSFIFVGRLRAVLLTYPSTSDIDELTLKPPSLS